MKDELSLIVKEQFYSQKKQSSIINDVKITPNEVKDFFSTINYDEIPLVPLKLELSQLVVLPILSKEKQQHHAVQNGSSAITQEPLSYCLW